MITRGTILSGATLSPCELYRYRLWRMWDPSLPRLGCVAQNPSKADETISDNTVTLMVNRAARTGFGSFEMLNAYAWRSTDPEALRHVVDPIGPDNDAVLMEAFQRIGHIIVAFGVPKWPSMERRYRDVYGMLRNCGVEPKAIARSKDGWPRHPLRLRNDMVPQPWAAP